MGFLENIARRFSAKPAPRHPSRRDYNAAMLSRLTASWTTTNLSANSDIYRNLDVLRARSRDLAQNNVYAKQFIKMVADNVVGPAGFTLQARVYDTADQPDAGANDAIEAAFARWSALGVCDVSGHSSFRDLCRMLATAAARDGEFLVRIVRGKSAGNAFGIALQAIDIDRLDTKLNDTAKGGNKIRMGVEINEFGRPVAYWLRTHHPGDMDHTAGQAVANHVRVPAEDILHRFVVDRPEQLRGVPWMHAAMSQMNNLDGYTEAAIIASRVGASKMGFFTSPDGDMAPLADGTDENGVPYTDADPGTFGTLPAGYDFKPFDPDYPSAMFGDFTKACLRGIASGLGVAYNALANDLEGVNYSSIRQGALAERDSWMLVQGWFIESFLRPVFAEWLKSALTFGQITLGNGSALPLSKLEKFSAHAWQGRRWQWVDPLKDIEAARLQVKSGVASPQMIAAQNGVDIEDVLADIARFEKMSAGIDTVGYVDKAAQLPAPPAEPKQDPETAKSLAVLSAEVRHIGLRVESSAPAPSITVPVSVALDADHLQEAAARVHDTLAAQGKALADQIREDIQNMPIVIPAPVVNVAAPVVTVENRVEPAAVTLEATLPPAEITVTLPPRRTDTAIKYNANGDIVATTQIETDV